MIGAVLLHPPPPTGAFMAGAGTATQIYCAAEFTRFYVPTNRKQGMLRNLQDKMHVVQLQVLLNKKNSVCSPF
jgi:hypothetical protein